jgi:Glycosyl transferases group 1
LNLRINFACDASELTRERRGYFDAFSRLGCAQLAQSAGESSDRTSANQELLLYPDSPTTMIPEALAQSETRTACFQIDVFSKPDWKARWSALFDYVFVFHPEFGHYFAKRGHSRVFLLPHAVSAAAYAADIDNERTNDIAWVGRIDGELYRTRRRLLPLLAARYKINDWQCSYPESEIPNVYRQATVAVNIGRDDYPSDANLRCFEVMASGALLLTSLPTELELMGFKEGVHFMGYSSERELFQKVDCLLADDDKRKRITGAARTLVMRDHTYDVRAQTILRLIENDADGLLAPARNWNSSRVDFVYLHYHCKRGSFSTAKTLFKRLLRNSPFVALRGLPLLLRRWQHDLSKRA